MTDDTRILVVFLLVFWGGWWLLAVVAKRSYIPVIPLVPLVAMAIGYGLNTLRQWVGTITLMLFHAGLLASMLLKARRDKPCGRKP